MKSPSCHNDLNKLDKILMDDLCRHLTRDCLALVLAAIAFGIHTNNVMTVTRYFAAPSNTTAITQAEQAEHSGK
jgi:hypothetical protein